MVVFREGHKWRWDLNAMFFVWKCKGAQGKERSIDGGGYIQLGVNCECFLAIECQCMCGRECECCVVCFSIKSVALKKVQ